MITPADERIELALVDLSFLEGELRKLQEDFDLPELNKIITKIQKKLKDTIFLLEEGY